VTIQLDHPDGARLDPDVPRPIIVERDRADRRYRLLAKGSGVTAMALMGLIGTFLLVKAVPALQSQGLGFLTNFEWNTDAETPQFGVAAILYWTVMIAGVAICVAAPIAVATALFINEYAPVRVRKVLTTLVDLLAAIPSLIYGLWGRDTFQSEAIGFSRFLDERAGFIPWFNTSTQQYDGSTLIAGLVVSLMVLPVAASVMREVFSQTPPGEKEAALALGATRWGMIRTVVLPFGRGGIVGGTMLGLGRALGETIAVALIISPIFFVRLSVTERGSNSVAALIANRFGEASELGVSALLAAGLVLFIVTLVVNLIASGIVARSRSGAGVDA